jgi:hypothetical protein
MRRASHCGGLVTAAHRTVAFMARELLTAYNKAYKLLFELSNGVASVQQ